LGLSHNCDLQAVCRGLSYPMKYFSILIMSCLALIFSSCSAAGTDGQTAEPQTERQAVPDDRKSAEPPSEDLAPNDLAPDDQALEEGSLGSDAIMTPETMTTLIQTIDKTAKVNPNNITFKIRDRDIILVYDTKARRMRIVAPIISEASVPPEIMTRMLKANFDAVLDVRYAIANTVVWAVFIHPLDNLTEKEFLSGIAQTFTAAETFGSSYTSGAMVFGGGDSGDLHEDLLKQLEKAAQPKQTDI